MNSIDIFLNKYKQAIEKMVIKQGPNDEELYQILCTYQSDNVDLSNSVGKVVSFVDDTIKKYIGSYLNQRKTIDLVYVNKNQGLLKHLDVSFDKKLPGVSETIQLYLSIDRSYYESVATEIYRFLLNNKISFKSTMSKVNRNDNFIIALYFKKDVYKIIEYIKQLNIVENLNPLNPFIYQINNIGIVKDVKGLSYNKYVSTVIQDYIEDCILNQRDNPYTSSDLQRFTVLRCEEADNYQDKIMSYNVACSLYSILTNTDIFQKINDQYTVKLDLKSIKGYKARLINAEYHYFVGEEEVDDEQNDYLRSQYALYYLYICKYEDINVKDYRLNHNIVNKMLKEIEDILTDNSCNLLINYVDKKLHRLIPYLYKYIAKKYKKCNEDEGRKIVEIIKNQMVILEEVNDTKYLYKVGNQEFSSDIPIIKNNFGFCAIEYIDHELNLTNITVVKNGKVKSYLNVYIDVNNVMIRNDKNYYGRLYRNAISNALLNFERNAKALEKRQNDFSHPFLIDNCKEVNQYVNVSIIKKIFQSLSAKQK